MRRLALLFGLGLAMAQTPAPQDMVLHIDVNLVQVDASVTDSHGRQVTDLQARVLYFAPV
jgi:hypothetical protein